MLAADAETKSSRCYVKEQRVGIKKISDWNSTPTLYTDLTASKSTSSNQNLYFSSRKFRVKYNFTYYCRKYESLEYQIVNLHQQLKGTNEVAVDGFKI